MKELSIEEKANRYDEAIEKLHEIITMDNKPVNPKEMGEYLFPELKESEDDEIRESIAGFLKTISSLKDGQTVSNEDFDTKVILEWVAWLKKQGEQKPVEWHIEDEQNLNACLGHIPDEFLRRWLKDVIHTKYDKSVDKVEPKFKVGDWVVCCDYEPEQIINITTDMYEMSNGDIRPFYMIDDNPYIRPWTIQDAKDGDVLATKDNRICIFDNTVEEGKHPFAYCGLSIYGFEVYDRTLPFTHLDVYPATKEQRDLLFTKMREAGYEWDKDKKELKKIEQTVEIPFGAKDSEFQEATYYIPEGYHAEINGNEVVIKKGKQKPSWSKEDEKKRTLLIKILEVNHPNGYFKVNPANTLNMEAISTEELISWLKSL